MKPVNHQVRLAARPSGLPDRADWELTAEPVPAPGPGEFLVAVSYLSVQPGDAPVDQGNVPRLRGPPAS